MTVCTFCPKPINVDTDYRLIVAWERKVRAGSRRGGSDVVLRKPSARDEWACVDCIRKLKRGVAVGQESLT